MTLAFCVLPLTAAGLLHEHIGLLAKLMIGKATARLFGQMVAIAAFV